MEGNHSPAISFKEGSMMDDGLMLPVEGCGKDNY